MGRWNEVLQTCDELLKLDGSQTEIWSICARAQQAQKLDADILKAWDVAAKSGLTQDWEACLKLIISAELLGPDVVKYQAQKEQAEQEMDAALRLDQAEEKINSRKWAEAEQLLQWITPLQPRYAPLRLNRPGYTIGKRSRPKPTYCQTSHRAPRLANHIERSCSHRKGSAFRF